CSLSHRPCGSASMEYHATCSLHISCLRHPGEGMRTTTPQVQHHWAQGPLQNHWRDASTHPILGRMKQPGH
ncbi:hypothetical protein NDU88_008498, partial [Pleurodeles waltl]